MRRVLGYAPAVPVLLSSLHAVLTAVPAIIGAWGGSSLARSRVPGKDEVP